MRLYPSLLKRLMPHGNIFNGKHRLEYKPDAIKRSQIRWELEVEEKNMLYLRHPYLTVKQSRNHMMELKKDSWEKILEKTKLARKNNWWKPVHFEDKLNHLRHKEGWE